MSFARQVSGFADQYKKRMRIVSKEAAQEVAEEAQTPRGEGGRMPIDTGFLRASISAAVGRMPSGPGKQVGDSLPSSDGLADGLLRWNPETGEPLYIGWTAVYARAMEYRYGFVRGAAEDWDRIVARVAKRVSRNV